MYHTPTPINCKEFYEQDREFVKQYIYDNEVVGKYYLAVIQVGSENESTAYINGKKKDFEYVGSSVKIFNISNKEAGFIKKISDMIIELNLDTQCAGIVVEVDRKIKRSFPDEVWQSIFKDINPHIDIDRAYYRNDIFVPATALGAVNLLEDYLKVDLCGKICCVIGRSQLVGKPLVDLLIKKNATVICCNSYTSEEKLMDVTYPSDIIISAVGKPHFLKPKYCEGKKIIIDIGTSYVDGKLVGDFDSKIYNEMSAMMLQRFDYDIQYTPVPGGMGLVTRGTLLRNFAVGISYREFMRKQTEKLNSMSDVIIGKPDNSSIKVCL